MARADVRQKSTDRATPVPKARAASGRERLLRKPNNRDLAKGMKVAKRVIRENKAWLKEMADR